MKLRSTFTIILTIIIAIGISSCSKSPEDKVKDYLNKLVEWIESGDFQKQLEAAMNNNEDAQKVFQTKQEQLLKDAGFASEEEFQQEIEKVKDDPKIIELTMKVTTASMKAMQPFKNKFQEKMQEALDTTSEAIEKAKEELEKVQQESKPE